MAPAMLVLLAFLLPVLSCNAERLQPGKPRSGRNPAAAPETRGAEPQGAHPHRRIFSGAKSGPLHYRGPARRGYGNAGARTRSAHFQRGRCAGTKARRIDRSDLEDDRKKAPGEKRAASDHTGGGRTGHRRGSQAILVGSASNALGLRSDLRGRQSAGDQGPPLERIRSSGVAMGENRLSPFHRSISHLAHRKNGYCARPHSALAVRRRFTPSFLVSAEEIEPASAGLIPAAAQRWSDTLPSLRIPESDLLSRIPGRGLNFGGARMDGAGILFAYNR